MLLGMLALAAAVLIAVWVALGVPAGDGVVVGGIDPCGALVTPGGLAYAAGTVTVYKGQVAWRSTGPGTSTIVFPPVVVAHATVGANSTYRFVLAPGHYVLGAHYLGDGNGVSYTDTTVKAGTTTEADIPNECI